MGFWARSCLSSVTSLCLIIILNPIVFDLLDDLIELDRYKSIAFNR